LFIFLCGIALTWKTASPVEETSPQVYLNHFYFVLDSSACREIEKSDFIRDEFSSVKERAKGGNRALASG
jgi:hypothetical protein